MTQSEELTLIRGVVASPEDDAPRLFYADWLEKQGRNPRARLIRVQCQLANLQAEEKELIKQFGQEWGKGLSAAGAAHWKYHRGFPEEICIGFPDFLRELDQLNEITPVRQLHLVNGTDEDLRHLAELPGADQIRSLELDYFSTSDGGSHYGVDGVKCLAESPYLKGLRQLRLHSHQIGVEGATVVAESATFMNLTDLAITDPALQMAGGEVVAKLIQSPNLANLTEFQVGDAEIGSKALQLIRSSRNRPGISYTPGG